MILRSVSGAVGVIFFCLSFGLQAGEGDESEQWTRIQRGRPILDAEKRRQRNRALILNLRQAVDGDSQAVLRRLGLTEREILEIVRKEEEEDGEEGSDSEVFDEEKTEELSPSSRRYTVKADEEREEHGSDEVVLTISRPSFEPRRSVHRRRTSSITSLPDVVIDIGKATF